jgi:PAS domain S-box-containing protein
MTEGTERGHDDELRRDDAARIRHLEDRIRVLSETMRAFAEATTDLDQLLDTVTQRVAQLIGDSCVLFILSSDGELAEPVAVHARDPAMRAKIDAMYAAGPVRLDEMAAARRILETGEALLVPRVDLALHSHLVSAAHVEHMKVVGTHSVLVVAVRAHRRPIGFLTLRRHAPESPQFDERDRDFAQTLADHAGLAITNARLLQAAKRDVAARTRAETRFTRLADAGIIGVIVGNLNGRIEEINDALLKMLGYSREEILSGSIPWIEITPPEWRALDQPAREQLASTGIARVREKEYLRSDGRRIPVLVGTAMLEGSDGDTISFVLDLTDRKVAEQARSRLVAIIDSSSDAILAKSLDGIIESWNAGAERLFGYSPGEALGQAAIMLLPPERRAEELVLLDRVARGLPVRSFETVRVRKDGTTLDVSLAVSPIRDAHGAIVGVSTIARDISASKRAERLLQESLAEKVVMLKEIHHRVKNNLQVVSSILRLHERHVTDPAARAAFEASQGRVRSIALLHEKLYQSRDLGSVGMASYARDLATTLMRTRGDSTGRVSVEVDDTGVYLPVNLAAPCGLILNELLTNAFNHAFVGQTGPGVVRIGVRQKDDMIELTVADNGVGLPPGFDINQLSSLGMFLARTLAEQVGGTLEIVTDHGTRCTLRFSECIEEG